MRTKRLFPAIVVLAIVGGGVFLFVRQQPSHEARLEAEREIYSILFASLVAPEEISEIKDFTLIDEYTSLGDSRGCTPENWCYPSIIEDVPQLRQATLADFREKNNESYPLREYLPSTIDNSLLAIDAQKAYWWRLSFSRIGFNSSLSQALVLVGDCRGDGCFSSQGEFIYGRGFFSLLEKVDGKWVIQDEAFAWITEKPAP
jgi:hypothetical protein